MSVETVGLGAGLDIPPEVSNEAVFEVLKHKIRHPDAYLPVGDVVVAPSADGLGVYRQMTLLSTGARITENIYHDGVGEVRFVVVDDPTEHVNKIVIGEDGSRRLEFYKRLTATGERVEWKAPMSVALGGIRKCLEAAAALKPGETLPA